MVALAVVQGFFGNAPQKPAVVSGNSPREEYKCIEGLLRSFGGQLVSRSKPRARLGTCFVVYPFVCMADQRRFMHATNWRGGGILQLRKLRLLMFTVVSSIRQSL